MKTSNITASSTEVDEITSSGKLPPKKKNEVDEPGHFSDDDDDDFDLSLDDDLNGLDDLDLDDDEY
jgi:hypothetical protein